MIKPVIYDASTLKVKPIDWLWKPYIPLKKITVLEGNPGTLKTFLALYVCCRTIALFGYNTMYLSSEDDPSDTILPRLKMISKCFPREVDLDKFNLLHHQYQGMYNEVFNISLSAPTVIEAAIKERKPRLVVIDPIADFLEPNKVATNLQFSYIRAKLGVLVRFADKYECAFLLLRHLVKQKGALGVARGMGSAGISATARSILRTGRLANGRHAMIHIKSNLHEKGDSAQYYIKNDKFIIGRKKGIKETALVE